MRNRSSNLPQDEQRHLSTGGADSADLGYEAHRLARLLRRSLEAELAPLGLTGPQAAVLLALGAQAVPAAPATLAESLGMDRPTLSGVLARLERGGWLDAEANPRDGRSRLLHLSPQARNVLPAVRCAARRSSARALTDLRAGDVEQLLRLMDSVARSLEAAHEGSTE